MSDTFLLEPDIIAAAENVMPDLNNDLLIAKNFLKQQSAPSGDSLYDHLVDLVHKILVEKPPDVVDNFEHFSWEVKKEKFKSNFDLLNDLYLSPRQLKFVRQMDAMCQVAEEQYLNDFQLLANKVKKSEDIGEEEEQLDLEEEHVEPKVQDLIEMNYYFKEAGFGLSDCECYAVFLALKMLAFTEPVSTVRFFGKIYGTKASYYVAETDLTVEELDKRIKEFDLVGMHGEEEQMEEEQAPEPEAEAQPEGEQVDTGPQPPKLPKCPVSTWQPSPPIPTERHGTGTNKKVYWVCNNPGDTWICLPDVKPEQLRVARQVVRCMTGDLDSEVLVFPPFDGTEKNFLRAQIGRIAAATSISPQGFYTFGSGEEEEDINLEEGGGDMNFNLNPFYQGHTLKDLMNSNLNYWVHHGRYILNQGRTIWWNPNARPEEELEEEEDEVARIPPELGPTLMTPLSDDTFIEGMRIWTPRCSSALVPDRSVVYLRSNLWPGAFAFSTVGKKSDCLYIGWGLKFLPPNYSPPQLPQVQDEYPIGPEVMEIADPTFAEEEAYRIAHLPPVPPPRIEEAWEGDLDAEEEDDEDEEEGEEE